MPHIETLWTLIAAPFMGSFLALLTVRLPRGEAVALARSRCRTCGAALKPADLVPVLSFMLAGRKCRHCGAAIAWRYPAVELAAAGIAAWAALVMPPHLVVPAAVLGWALLTVAIIDAEHFLIPDVLSVTLLATGLLTAALLIDGHLVDALIGAGLGGALLWAVAGLYRRFRGRDGLGFGDVKLMAAGGAWVGWQGLSTVLLWAVMCAFATLFILRLRGMELSGETAVPFGTFLAAGIWLTWLYGPLVFGL